MDPYFFRVEHDLLRSESFKELGGSAIKVYLVIGLYSDFGSGWAYPSIRTIARQAGLSRQTVLDAIASLTRAGLLATSKSQGRSTAYRIIRQAPERPSKRSGKAVRNPHSTVPESFEETPSSVLISLEASPETGPEFFVAQAQRPGRSGPADRPKQEPVTRSEHNASIPIPGTPFRLTADGRLLVSVDLQELLTDQGLPQQLAARLATQKEPEEVAKVLLNALYLQSQGKLQNRPGYIRAGLEDGYELLPQVADRLESRRRALQDRLVELQRTQERQRREVEKAVEEEAINLVIESLHPEELQHLVESAIASLPGPIVRRNPTLSNPFVRSKVYELACGEPQE